MSSEAGPETFRRCVGEVGIDSSERGSVSVGSSFGASVKVGGEPIPPGGDADDTLEYRLLLLSPFVEAVRGGDTGISSATSAFSGSTVDSRLIPGN